MTDTPAKEAASARWPARLAPIVITLLTAIMLWSGFASHLSRNLNLSGDEVHFYFLSVRNFYDNEDVYIDRVDEQFRAARAHLTTTEVDSQATTNFHTSEVFFGLQPQFFREYQLPTFIWALVSNAVAPRAQLASEEKYFPAALADSIFYGLLASGLLTIAFATTLSGFMPLISRLTLAIFAVLALVRDRFLTLDGNVAWAPNATASHFLESVFSANKDFMIYGFSPRSLFLILLAVACTVRWTRWRAPSNFSPASLLLPLLPFVHASHGVLAVGMFLAIDLIVHRARTLHAPDLLAYALAFALGMQGGMGSETITYIALMSLVTALLMAAGLRLVRPRAHDEHVAAHAEFSLRLFLSDAIPFLVIAGGAIFVLQPLVDAAHLSDETFFWFRVSVQRLGVTFGPLLVVSVAAGLAWAIVHFTPESRRHWAGLGGAGAAALLSFFLVGLPLNLDPVKQRLRSQSEEYNAATAEPITFGVNNELHLIWLSILQSMVFDQDLTVVFPATMVDATAAGAPPRTRRAPSFNDALVSELVTQIGAQARVIPIMQADGRRIQALRTMPPFTTTIEVPPNAASFTLTVDLEPESWTRHRETSSDGLTLVFDFAAGSESIGSTTETLSPAIQRSPGPKQFIVPVPANARTMTLRVTPGRNEANDNASYFGFGFRRH